jgi:hypothetical protein
MLIKMMDNFTYNIMIIINNLESLIGLKSNKVLLKYKFNLIKFYKQVTEFHSNKLDIKIFLTNLKFSLQHLDVIIIKKKKNIKYICKF